MQESPTVDVAARLRVVFAATASCDSETRWALGAANALRARGHEVTLASSAGTALASAGPAHEFHAHELRTGVRLDPRVARAARHAFQGSHAIIALDADALALARRVAAPLVFARAERRVTWGSTDGAAAVLVPPDDACGPAAAVAAPNSTIAAAAANGGSRVRVVADALPESPRPDPLATRRALRLPRRVHLALHVAPLTDGCGHETLLRAMAQLVAGGGDAKPPVLAFIGTGAAESQLRVLSQDLDVKDHVLWLGTRKDTTAYIAAADSLWVPAPHATPRHVLLDAFAFGIPIVAQDARAVRDAVGDAARWIASDASASWARALAEAGTPALAPPEAARRRTAAELSPAALAADLECAIYAHALHRQRRARRAALFLDRDGTLVANVPYNNDPEAVRLEPRAGRALRWAHDAGYALVVVSNQSGIGRGLVTPAQVEAIHARIRTELRAAGADLHALYYCPHLPQDDCACRKPRPGLLQRAAAEMQLDLAASTVIGDAPRDIEAGRAAGTRVRGYRGVAAEAHEWSPDTRVHDDWLMLVRDVLAEAWTSG